MSQVQSSEKMSIRSRRPYRNSKSIDIMANIGDENTATLADGIANLDLNERPSTTSTDGTQQHIPNVPDPLAALSNTPYALRTRVLIGLNDQLRQCGLEQFFSLPKIAVVGVQSSGKSSIIEAISQIKVLDTVELVHDARWK